MLGAAQSRSVTRRMRLPAGSPGTSGSVARRLRLPAQPGSPIEEDVPSRGRVSCAAIPSCRRARLRVDAKYAQRLQELVPGLGGLLQDTELKRLVLTLEDNHQQQVAVLRLQRGDDRAREAVLVVLPKRVDVLDGSDRAGNVGEVWVSRQHHDQILEASINPVLRSDRLVLLWVPSYRLQIHARAPLDRSSRKAVYERLQAQLLPNLLLLGE
mmetsp:Transcript_16550/g.44332  ORF Transcript_16550/g.44332 Transcript_16550/m.44332 type:complete len:212 (+) Transcript_16550:96-731(+)